LFKDADGSLASSKDLRVDFRIWVEGDLTKSDEMVAQRIEMLKTPSKKIVSQMCVDFEMGLALGFSRYYTFGQNGEVLENRS
jgi:hypothetical protein